MVNDYYPHDNPAKDTLKPSLMFDGNPVTFYHSWVGSSSPGVKIYFGAEFTVSKIIFIPRYDHYLTSNENTIFSILKENGDEEDCGTLTGTDTQTKTVEAQTYEMSCANKEGVGLKVWKKTGGNWCAAEITVSYSDR